ncbi:MAG: hypothetical protein JWN75_1070 [Candidatus Saccharibacteria bacterium]|nr:hypothetical protein [Candidatus Saccharibacteria bacterium]
MASTSKYITTTARTRIIIAIAVGLGAGILGVMFGAAKIAPLIAWDSTVFVYACWVWLTVWTMDAGNTKSHALRENPGRALADAILLFASIASIGAVIVLLIDASNSEGITKVVDIILSLVSIVLSWMMVHTVYMLKYARLYYGIPEGGINYNQKDDPQYTDFAYLAFTLGMTFQVSDNDLQTKEIRITALKHTLLSYLFGTVIIATTINTLASLSQ